MRADATMSMQSISNGPRDFVTHLRQMAVTRPDDTALTVAFGQDGGTVETVLTYKALDRRVRALASVLQQSFQPGERALIMLDNDEHHVVGFFACQYAGLIAVPVFPPESIRPQHLARLVGIAEDAGACCILTHHGIRAMLDKSDETFGDAAVIAIEGVDERDADRWAARTPAHSDIAFLQYTSGSTSAPKGVMVTHGNLMANMRAIQEGLSVGSGDVFVSWLPLNHDMGLIGGLLQPLHRGIPVVLMSPRFFLERPVRWLEAISRHRGTISGGPDFAYRLCLERVTAQQLAKLDLSSWAVAFSGAEPVRAETLRAFEAHLAPAGFRGGALYPCYGLAEATLFVSGGRRGAGLNARDFLATGLTKGQVVCAEAVGSDASTLVGCGEPVSHHQVAIVDPETLVELGPDGIGEIWAAGPSIARGYWNKLAQTEETFVERGGHTWLRTGDLGFLREGQLYVAGRMKDMIIVRGHNLYPQDLERVVECEVDLVRKGRIAAFAVGSPEGEGIGLAVEVSRGTQKLVEPGLLVEALSAAVSEQCGEPLSVVLLLQPGAMPKTTSGKLQRGACRQGWEDGSIDAYAVWERGVFVRGGVKPGAAVASSGFDDTEAKVADIWREVLRLDARQALGRDAHFFVSGGTSLTATQAALRMSEQWHVALSARVLFERPRLHDCAAGVREALAQAPGALAGTGPVALEGGDVARALSHAQQRQWFLWRLDPEDPAHHVSVVLHLQGALQEAALRQALNALVSRHASLRTVFLPGDDDMGLQRVIDGLEIDLPVIDLPVIDLRDALESSRQSLADDAARQLDARPFDLVRGPLLRAALLKLADDAHRLVLCMHHAISDAGSVQVMVDELGLLYAAAMGREVTALPTLPCQYADYAVWQKAWLADGAGERQLTHWRACLGDEHPPLLLPSDHPRQPVARHRAGHHVVGLPAGAVAALRSAMAEQGGTLFMALLATFQAMLWRRTAQRDIRIGVPTANRHHAGLATLVGFFVNTLVSRCLIDEDTTPAQLMQQVRAWALAAQEHQDLPFDHLVEALQPKRSLGQTPLFQVLFNHLQHDVRGFERLTGLGARVETVQGPAAQFELSLETVEAPDGHVHARFTYARDLFEPETVARMGDHYIALLQAFANSPTRPVSHADLLSDPERATLLDRGRCALRLDVEPIHRRIEAQAWANPHAMAVVYEDQSLSYGQLDEQANRLAHRLVKLGVGPEVRVGLALERSTSMIVALVAILKAGGAYVPLDPDYPT
ncbi:MAG: non-ribosomal peptide synthetase, partial [Rubrivivax sp.]